MGVSILSNVLQNGNIREVNCCGYLFVFAGDWEVIINIHLGSKSNYFSPLLMAIRKRDCCKRRR
jgi:hypothetical protein